MYHWTMSSSEAVGWLTNLAEEESVVAMAEVVWMTDMFLKGDEAVLERPTEFLLMGTIEVVCVLGFSTAGEEVVTVLVSWFEEMERSIMAETGALMVVMVEELWSLMTILGTLGCSYWCLTSLGLGGMKDQSEISTVGVSGGVGGMNSGLDSRALSSGVAG